MLQTFGDDVILPNFVLFLPKGTESLHFQFVTIIYVYWPSTLDISQLNEAYTVVINLK